MLKDEEIAWLSLDLKKSWKLVSEQQDYVTSKDDECEKLLDEIKQLDEQIVNLKEELKQVTLTNSTSEERIKTLTSEIEEFKQVELWYQEKLHGLQQKYNEL